MRIVCSFKSEQRILDAMLCKHTIYLYTIHTIDIAIQILSCQYMCDIFLVVFSKSIQVLIIIAIALSTKLKHTWCYKIIKALNSSICNIQQWNICLKKKTKNMFFFIINTATNKHSHCTLKHTWCYEIMK